MRTANSESWMLPGIWGFEDPFTIDFIWRPSLLSSLRSPFWNSRYHDIFIFKPSKAMGSLLALTGDLGLGWPCSFLGPFALLMDVNQGVLPVAVLSGILVLTFLLFL